jgi:hypothetical protein
MLTSCGRRDAAIGLGHLDVLPMDRPDANLVDVLSAAVWRLRSGRTEGSCQLRRSASANPHCGAASLTGTSDFDK